jgi:hypothetical protein
VLSGDEQTLVDAYTEASRQIVTAFERHTLHLGHHVVGSWLESGIEWAERPRLYVFGPAVPGSTVDPARLYQLEWTDRDPDVSRALHEPFNGLRTSYAKASRADGSCLCHNHVQKIDGNVQAGVGFLYQPTRLGGFLQMRPYVNWTTRLWLEADHPPTVPPGDTAWAFSYGELRLIVQSWRASDGAEFRTDAVRGVPLWNRSVAYKDRLAPWEDNGVASMATDAWVEVPSSRQRMYAFWVVLRLYDKSVWGTSALSASVPTASCVAPFMVLEHRP